MRTVLGWLAAAVVAVGLIYVLAAINLGLWLPWATNKQTEVIRNTNQYVTTQQADINGLVRQYDKLNLYEQTEEIDRQQSNLAYMMCDAADKIDAQYIPEPALAIMREEGCN